MNFKEKFFTSLLLIVIAVSFVWWIGAIYLDLTKAVPKAGGQYTEGIVGQPLYVNPLISQTSEADSDLAKLIYSGLFKYDKEGKVVPDLAQGFSISEDQKTYTVTLRKGLLWHDDKPLTASDVIFTFSILQDPAYKSPLRLSMQGVDVSMQDENTVVFNLKNPYVGFLENLTVGLLPKHIWENISPEKFALAEYNLLPVGSGPYAYKDLQKDAGGNILTYSLVAFKNYYDGKPYISKLIFNFYQDDSALMAGYNKKEIMGMGSITPESIKDIKNVKSTNVHELVIPRYFAVFFNQTKNVALATDPVRSALNLSVDRQGLIDTLLHGEGVQLSSPFFPQMQGYSDESKAQLNLDEANKILDDAGWKLDSNDNIRKKSGENLEFELLTPDWPELTQTANLLAGQWAKVGAKVNVNVLTVSDLQQNHIRTRDYDALLFGQATTFNPDLYAFWHSSQKHDPGLNLSLFDNKDVDGILESVRQETDEAKRLDDFKQFQSILAKEVPAVFLYGRYYLYPTSTTVQGIEVRDISAPEQRFTDVNKWFVKTQRVLK